MASGTAELQNVVVSGDIGSIRTKPKFLPSSLSLWKNPNHPTSWKSVHYSRTLKVLLGSKCRGGHHLAKRIRLTLILLTWRIWWAPNNASKRQMGFNWAFKGLKYFIQRMHTSKKTLLRIPRRNICMPISEGRSHFYIKPSQFSVSLLATPFHRDLAMNMKHYQRLSVRMDQHLRHAEIN